MDNAHATSWHHEICEKNNVSVHIRERDFSPATSGNELHGVLHPSSNMQVFCHSINLSAYLGARKIRAQQNCTEINLWRHLFAIENGVERRHFGTK